MPPISARDLLTCAVLAASDILAFRCLPAGCIWRARLMSLPGQAAHRRGNPKNIRIAWGRGIAAGEVGAALESVPHGVWMNEQLPGAGLDRATGIQISVQRLS